MARTLTFVLLIGSICFCQAQEDRPLPPLLAMDPDDPVMPEAIVFHTRAPVPIVIDVRRDGNKVSLVAKNTTDYPYTLTVHFTTIRNLVPDPDSIMTFVALPGTRVLTNFRIFEISQSFDFDFKVDKEIGEAGATPIEDFPYLIPVSDNKPVELPSDNLNDTQDFQPVFVLRKADTVHAMRKGVVTAIPLPDEKIDRISSNSIEIRHMDGTVMVYENMVFSEVFVEPGKTVYPGQPLATCGPSDLFVSLFHLEDKKLKRMEILFYIDQETIVPFSKIKNGQHADHPVAIVTKEMDRKEIRRWKKR